MEKINLVKLLKDCPKGMELNCTMFDGIFLEKVNDDPDYPILITTKEGRTWSLTMNGCWDNTPSAKCIIFPKGKTTWEGFVPLCKFKDGDIVATDSGNWIGITTGGNAHSLIPTYCVIKQNGKFEAYIDRKNKWCFSRLANKNEKQKLFQAIKDNGYRWNTETKTLEKLVGPRFHEGNWIVFNGLTLYVKEVVKGFYRTISKGGIPNSYDWDIDSIARLWTINDAKDGDVVCYKDEISLYKHDIKNCTKHGTTFGGFVYHCGYDGKRFITDSLYSLTEQDKINIHPATKEQRDLLFQKMKEAGYKWVI